MGDATDGGATGGRGFKKSGLALHAYSLALAGTASRCILARRTLGVGDAGVCRGAVSRRVCLEESVWAHLALGLSGGSSGYLRVFAGRTLGVGGAPLQRTIYWQVAQIKSTNIMSIVWVCYIDGERVPIDYVTDCKHKCLARCCS